MKNNLIRNIADYLNPFSRLGEKKYSYFFPLLITIATAVLSWVYSYNIAGNQLIVTYIALVFMPALIVYFALRDGLKGGLISFLVTIVFYAAIIIKQGATGAQLRSQIELTLLLASLYLVLAGVVGWLRQKTDDLIEREANEKLRLQAIIQQLPVGVLITDPKGNIDQSNRLMDQLSGNQTPSGNIKDLPVNTNIGYKSRKSRTSDFPLIQTLATGKQVVGREFAIVKENGKKVFMQVSSSMVKNKAGKPMAAVVITNDITHQKEMELRKDEFINMASHELKTPLTSIGLYLASLRKLIPKEPATTKVLKSAEYQVGNLKDLVNDLLDVSRIQTGKLSVSKEEIDIIQIVRGVVGDMKSSVGNHKINVSGTGSIKVVADKLRIYQVLANLITNAVKYSPEKGDIDIEVKKYGKKLIISVRDYGIGIDPEQQNKIFDRLYQVNEPTEKTYPGLGLGLYISKEIIKRHKGNIWVESNKGQGSTFYFSLPLTK